MARTEVSRDTALGWRLGRHFLAGAPASSVVEVVDRLIAVPSWLGDAERSVALRLGGVRSDAVDVAFRAGDLLKVYSFRGSMHFMTPAQASVHLTIRTAGRQWELQSWRDFYGLEPETWPVLRASVREALAGGPLTQAELAAAVGRGRFSGIRGALLHRSHTLIKPLSWLGDLSFAPSVAGEPTFQALAGRADWPGLLDFDDAGHRAVVSYLASYGPATADRLQYWLTEGLSAGRRRVDRWIDELAEQLVRVTVEGVETLALSADLDSLLAADSSDQVLLLPAYDQWVIGAGTSDANIVPPEHRAAISRGAAVALRGGRVRGTWKDSPSGPDISWFG